ncbi:transcriptional regulator [Bacillus methanolicus PB1]|uniref:Transcriptional regulator n=1 Tax=Bacillus methanolicus PB1 TaxID=997296 RepID=I3DXN5_BACMT|nr:TetR family transcriptional regulator [Bacillus methanolicus]EIJ79006.1 transcriptional regulator [Bacillus methanolicus PB1]
MSPKVSEEHREYRRRKILEAAIRVFKRKGFEKTTMQDIVDESGMSRGGVYLYFSNREDLFKELINFFDKQQKELINFFDKQQVEEIDLLYQNVSSTWEGVLRFLEAQEQEIKEVDESLTPVILEYYMIDLREKTKDAFLSNRYQKAVEILELLFQKGVDEEEFKPVIPISQVARFVVAFLDGLIMEAIYLGTEEVKIQQQMNTLRQTLKKLLGVEQTE